MVNKHGIKMRGLKAAAGETKATYKNGPYVQISYDRETGDILATWHKSANNWIEYHDKAIIHVCNAHKPMTMQEIADRIHIALTQARYTEE